jgi:hypothetical protein
MYWPTVKEYLFGPWGAMMILKLSTEELDELNRLIQLNEGWRFECVVTVLSRAMMKSIPISRIDRNQVDCK